MPYSSEYDIQWPPNRSDVFVVVWKQYVYLFRLEQASSAHGDSNSFIIGSKLRFLLSVLNIWSNNVSPQCVAWVPSSNKLNLDVVPNHLIAITHNVGCVKLMGLPNCNVEEDRFGLQNKELTPRFSRNTTFLVWNPWKRNLLAQGFDRPRNSREPSVLIWDVTKYTGSRHTNVKSTDRGSVCANDLHTHTYSLPFAINGSDYSVPDTQATSSLVSVYSSVSDKEWISNTTTCEKPLCDLGIQDTASFAWLSKSSFIAGMSGTYLKVFDLSDLSKVCQITTTRAVYGLTVDPLCSKRFASFCERQISLWRLDNLEKPVYTFMESGDVLQIKWSPLREAWLGVLVTDSCTVKLYDTYSMFCQSIEEPEQIPLERLLFPSSRSNVNLVAFSWHPSNINCLLTLNRDGCLNVAQLVERPAIGWSANQTLVWSYTRDWTAFSLTGIVSSNLQTLMEFLHAVNDNKRSETSVNNSNTTYSLSNAQYLANCQNIKNKDYHNDNNNDKNKRSHEKQTELLVQLKRCMELDVAVVMRKRAELGYGLDITGATYVEIVKDDVQLRTMWTWIKYINDYMDDPLIRRHLDVDSSQSNYTSNQRNGTDSIPSKRRVPFRGSGVISLLCDNSSSSGTKLTSEVLMNVEWQGIDVKLPFSRYRSPERSRVLRFCMWPLDDTDVVQRPVFESLCSEGQYERAAAMALINLKFDWALSFLNRASSDADIDLVALALAGYTDTRNELWRTTCANLIKHLQNPYLRVMFVFLSRQGGDFQSILNDDALCLIDRVACACLYLNDDDLLVFLRSTCNSMVQRGQLESILLTGLCSNDFINLIQNYVDTTGDVQSAAIVGLHACQLSLNDNYSMVNNDKRTDTNDNNNLNNSRHLQIVLNGARSSTVDKKLSTPVGGGYVGRGYLSGSSIGVQQPMVIKLGGLKIANWVQCYRDLLDQWQMWFYRADFDITYKSRLLSDYLYPPSTSRTQMSSSLLTSSKSVEADIPTTSTISGTSSTNTITTNNNTVTTVSTSNTNSSSYGSKVRNFGFIAGANQAFVACGFCGWRLEPQNNKLNMFNIGCISGAGSGGSNTSNTMNSPSMIDTPCSPTATTTTTNLQMHGGGGKLTICQHCRKPLPRCSICLMHLGTSIPSNEYTSVNNAIKSAESMFQQTALTSTGKLSVDFMNAMQINTTSSSIPLSEDNAINKNNQKNLYSSPEKSSPVPNSISMADWFVWCQACRHGGHASHLTDWFYGDSFDLGDNGYSKECPVSGCQCHCAALDVNQTLSQLNYSRSSINSRSPDSEESSSLVDNEPIG